MPDRSLTGVRNILRHSSVVLTADLTLMVGRLGVFILLANALGTFTMGAYVAVLGMVQIVFPAAVWGTSHVAIRRVATGSSMFEEWKLVLSTTARFGSVLAVICAGIGWILFDVDVRAMFLIAIAQLIGMSLQGAAHAIATGDGRPELGLLANAASTGTRFAAAVIFVVRGSESLTEWSVFFAVASGIAVVITVFIMAGGSRPRVGLAMSSASDLREGSGYVFAQGASTAQADIDKVVLGAYGLQVDNGNYAAANRVADIAAVPLVALVSATYAEFFRRGSEDFAEVYRYAKKLTMAAVGYGAVVAVGLWLTAPLLTFVLDDEYAEAVDVLRVLALLPMVKATQFFPGNVLTGTGRQWHRASAMWVTALLNLVANIVLAPSFGWRGAVGATYVAEILFAALLWWLVIRGLSESNAESVDERSTIGQDESL